MSLSRMVVLGLLAEGGPMYGHQLRRQADSMHVESWAASKSVEYAAQLGTTALKSAGTGMPRARAQRVARPRRRSTSREDATTPAAVEGPRGSR
jgi:hypothetical protein